MAGFEKMSEAFFRLWNKMGWLFEYLLSRPLLLAAWVISRVADLIPDKSPDEGGAE